MTPKITMTATAFTRVTTTTTATITAADLRAAFGIPEGADIWVQVPGGGDWSHEALPIDEHPVRVQWTTVDDAADAG